MKFLRILLVTIAMFVANSVYAAHQLYADKDGAKLPYGTSIDLKMAQDVSSANITNGDIIQAYLAKDIYINNKLILPSGTIFRGRISQINKSRRFSRPAKLYMTLDHLVTKSGTQLSLKSGISSDFNYVLKDDGAITTNGNYFKAVSRDAKKSGQIVKRTVNWGKTSDEALFKGAKFIVVPIAAVGGSIACVCSATYNTFADMFRKGDEIIIKKNADFTVVLLSALDLPI